MPKVVNPPAVLRRKTAQGLWKGIVKTSVVPPLSLLKAKSCYSHSYSMQHVVETGANTVSDSTLELPRFACSVSELSADLCLRQRDLEQMYGEEFGGSNSSFSEHYFATTRVSSAGDLAKWQHLVSKQLIELKYCDTNMLSLLRNTYDL